MKSLHLLSFGYYASYVLTGLAAKYFVNSQEGYPNLDRTEYSFLSLLGSNLFCLLVILIRHFLKPPLQLQTPTGYRKWLKKRLASIIVSGGCLSIITITSIMLFSLAVPVMETMAMMSSIVIIASKAVDQWFSHQEPLTGKRAENTALALSFLAIFSQLLFTTNPGNESLLNSHEALALLSLYTAAYSFRLYSINQCKQIDRNQKTLPDSWAYFSVEQAVNFAAMILAGLVFMAFSFQGTEAIDLHFQTIHFLAIVGGIAFGSVGVCSRLLLLLTGVTTTYIALINKALYILAGMTASIAAQYLFNQPSPTPADYCSSLFALSAGVTLFVPFADRRPCKLMAGSVKPH